MRRIGQCEYFVSVIFLFAIWTYEGSNYVHNGASELYAASCFIQNLTNTPSGLEVLDDS